MMTELEVNNARYLAKMREEGVDIRQFPDEVLHALKEITREVQNHSDR